MKSTLTFISLFLVLSCAKVSKVLPGQDSKNANNAESSDPNEIEVQQTLHGVQGKAGFYHYSLSWRGAEKYSEVYVSKKFENEEKALAPFATNNSAFSDNDLKSGQVIEYKIIGVWEGAKYLLYQNKFSVPEDLVVSGDFNLKNSFRSPNGRIFFEKGAVLRTNGQNIRIDADSIFTDGEATIHTIPLAPAGIAQKGLNGGLLFLKAKKLNGNLRIYSQGQKGGKGISGFPGNNGSAGPNGRDAQQYRCMDGYPEYRATPGGSGQNGGTGGSGGQGEVGGNSATVRVEIENSAAKVLVERIPGAGGDGGDGGPGGSGGEGGRGGSGAAPSRPGCEGAPNGNRGQNGLPGVQGFAGEAGKESPYCVRVGADYAEGPCEKVPVELFSKL